MEERIMRQLSRRRREGTLRCLLPVNELEANSLRLSPDFSSNDYLGLAQSDCQRDLVAAAYLKWETEKRRQLLLGATGSRLLSGDSPMCRRLEQFLAKVHHSEGALLMNSGYDANLSILSSVPMGGDAVIMDELVHNSLVMGVRMSRLPSSSVHQFRHNDLDSLRGLLQKVTPTSNQTFIVVESVYSMDGDVGPLSEILNLAHQFEARVIVDEAHGLGVYGKTNIMHMELPESRVASSFTNEAGTNSQTLTAGTGVLAALGLETHPALLCSVFTFGKAAGCHGGVVCGSQIFMQYLINYARPLIYSTALPTHSLFMVEYAYRTMMADAESLRTRVFKLVRLFRILMLAVLPSSDRVEGAGSLCASLWPSPSPIQALVVPGNSVCILFCRRVKNACGTVLYPIRSPTVPRGKERVRIILHAHNTEEEVHLLVQVLLDTLKSMNLLRPSSRL